MKSFLEYVQVISESAKAGLAAKAEKSGVSLSILKKVYARGVAAWNSGHRPGTTPEQWGMARVNSYITKGEGTYHGADKDLREETLEEASGHTIEAHGVKGMKSTPWRKTFKHADHLNDWAEKNDADVHGTRDLEQSKKGNLSPAMKEEAVPKDKKSGLPKKYVSGLSTSTAKARAAHWDKMDKLSDRDPRAYEPAPGDATAKTKESKHTKKYRELFGEEIDEELYEACWDGYKQVGIKKKGDKMVPDCVKTNEELESQFDLIEEVIEELALNEGVDSETIWESLEEVSDEELLEYAIDAKGHKSSTGGLTQKGVDAYNRKTGGNLKTAVTTPPSKLKPGSKAANRRKSFCARMSGVDGPMKKPNGEPTRKALALRKWNC